MPRSRPLPKPETHNGDLRNLPLALQPLTQFKRFVAWRWEWRQKEFKWTKPPRQPLTLDYGKSNDPGTWGDYLDAVAAVEAGKADGIGLMLHGLKLGAADLDHCRDLLTGKIEPWAQAQIDSADGIYIEVSPSAGV